MMVRPMRQVVVWYAPMEVAKPSRWIVRFVSALSHSIVVEGGQEGEIEVVVIWREVVFGRRRRKGRIVERDFRRILVLEREGDCLEAGVLDSAEG